MGHCQTFAQWKFEMLICKINRMFAQRSLKLSRILLYFLPIGPFPDFIHEFREKKSNRSFFQLLCDFVKSFFSGVELLVLPECNISDIQAVSRHHPLTGKLQYHVSDILTFLQKRLPRDGFAILGVTWHDMYPCENLNFILGQGSSQHSACITSFGRFDPTFVKGFKGQEEGIQPEDMKDITEIDGEIIWKLFKIISHETCHVFGVLHCNVFECLMNASSSTREAMSQPLYLCPLCMSKIQHLKLSLCATEDPKNLTISSHFKLLTEFLLTVYDGDEGMKCQKADETLLWLQRMNQYLERSNDNEQSNSL